MDMDVQIQTSSSPNLGPIVRRRKKRVTTASNPATMNGGGGCIPIPGSNLNGLNRNGIRIVELSRGKVGYGFTISGQKPCLLRCIVEGSPASKANLRPGNCLVGVNSRDVSHLSHDEVVALIGQCTGLLRLHVAESYFSESSDEETLQISYPRPKYPNRIRGLSKTSLSTKLSSNSNSNEEQQFESIPPAFDKKLPFTSSIEPNYNNFIATSGRHSPTNSSSVPSFSSFGRLTPGGGCSNLNEFGILGEESPIPALPSRSRKIVNPAVESVRVFSSQDNNNDKISSTVAGPNINNNCRSIVGKPSMKTMSIPNNLPTSSVAGDQFNPLISNTRTTSATDCVSSSSSHSIYQAVVGYVGSVELPAIEERKRLQALTACVRRLRVERRMRSIVLLRIQPNGICLFGSNQNVQTGPPLAFYSSGIISFCGAYNEDRRFFGLVTCTTSSSTKICSCHVFMVDPKLLSHFDHLKRARSFGIQCTALPMHKHDQVLGLQECIEFPATADPVLSSIVRLHGPTDETLMTTTTRIPNTQRSPSEASTRLESTNSSNSDSGVGFRDESDRNSARIYDVVDSEVMFDMKSSVQRYSPLSLPTMRHANKMTAIIPSFTSSSCPSGCFECHHHHHDHEDDILISASVPSGEAALTFQADPLSLQEILGCDDSGTSSRSPKVKNHHRTSNRLEDNFNNSRTSNVPPQHIEVSVVVTPRSEKKSTSYNEASETENFKKCTKLSRNSATSRSLDNLCSVTATLTEVINKHQPDNVESRGNMGSTPTLNQESKPGNGIDFWGFKVPRPPKPKREMSRVESWAENIENLLADQCGRQVFTEFLQHEFSAENILFYNACIRYKKVYPNLTECQRISLASNIFQRYVQNGASDPVNVDFQARSHVEKLLPQPTPDMFDLPLGQVYNLLKFDCYPRFLRSDTYRDYSTGVATLTQYDETSDSDQDSTKSHKLDGERRRSLLPWHIKNRSKNKHKFKDDSERLNSDISFIQRTAITKNTESSDTDDSRRQSYKLCRVTLPDNSTTVLPCKPGESLSIVVQRLLEKREFHYAAFEVVNVATGKALDLNLEASEMTAKEIRVEPRSFIGIELPKGWKVGVRANPFRKVAEVLKPILTQHGLKLDSVVVYDIDAEEKIDVKVPMARLDGHNLLVKLKDPQLEEITNHIPDACYDSSNGLDDDDLMSTKTGSSQSSSVFRGFLRRSSKYKRKAKAKQQIAGGLEITKDQLLGNNDTESIHSYILSKHQDENFQPLQQQQRLCQLNAHHESSPLSLVSAELKLPESSRNRKPIYIAQINDSSTTKDDS